MSFGFPCCLPPPLLYHHRGAGLAGAEGVGEFGCDCYVNIYKKAALTGGLAI